MSASLALEAAIENLDFPPSRRAAQPGVGGAGCEAPISRRAAGPHSPVSHVPNKRRAFLCYFETPYEREMQ